MSSSNTCNVVQLGIGFFCIFFAFNTQGAIEETVLNSHIGIQKHAGYKRYFFSCLMPYFSLAIIYFFFTFSNFFAAPIVRLLNARWAMVLGAITYVLFQFGFLFLNNIYLILSSVLIGFGAAGK